MAGNGVDVSVAINAINNARKALDDAEADIKDLGEAADDAAPKLDKAGRATDDLADKAGKSHGILGKLGGALGGVAQIAGGFVIGNALSQLPGFLIGAAQGAAEDEAATKRLELAVRNSGEAFDESIGKINERIDAGAKLAFSDDEVRDSFQFLLAAGNSVDESLAKQTAAMDLARGANIPLATATKMLGKLNEENVEVFKKLGITLGENATEADALAKVQEKFGGQSKAYADSTAGQFAQTKIQMAELKEQIGYALLPVMTKLGQTLVNDVIPAVQAFANKVGPVIKQFAADVKSYYESDIKPALDNLQDAWEKIAPVVLPIIIGIGKELQIMATIVGNVVSLIVNLLGGDWKDAWQDAKDIFGGFVDLVQNRIDTVWQVIQGVIPLAAEAARALGGAIADGIRGAFDGLVSYVTGIINSIISAYNNTVGRIPGAPSISTIGGGGGATPGGVPTATSAWEAGYENSEMLERPTPPTGAYGQQMYWDDDAHAWVYKQDIGMYDGFLRYGDSGTGRGSGGSGFTPTPGYQFPIIVVRANVPLDILGTELRRDGDRGF